MLIEINLACLELKRKKERKKTCFMLNLVHSTKGRNILHLGRIGSVIS